MATPQSRGPSQILKHLFNLPPFQNWKTQRYLTTVYLLTGIQWQQRKSS